MKTTCRCAWTADGRDLWVARYEDTPPRIERVDVSSGHARLWNRLGSSAPSGLHGQYRIMVTPDGESYAYSFGRRTSELSGLRCRRRMWLQTRVAPAVVRWLTPGL